MLQIARDVGDMRNVAVASMNLAETEFALGDTRRAIERATTNLTNYDATSMGSDLRAAQESNLAAYLFALGRYREARSMALAAIEDADSDYVAIPLQHLTAILALQHPKRAARLLGYVEKVFAEAPFVRQHPEQCTYDFLITTLRRTMDDDQIAKLGREGAAMTEAQILQLARRSPLSSRASGAVAKTIIEAKSNAKKDERQRRMGAPP